MFSAWHVVGVLLAERIIGIIQKPSNLAILGNCSYLGFLNILDFAEQYSLFTRKCTH